MKRDIQAIDIETEAISKKIKLTQSRIETIKKTNGELEKKLCDLNEQKETVENECRKIQIQIQEQRRKDKNDGGMN